MADRFEGRVVQLVDCSLRSLRRSLMLALRMRMDFFMTRCVSSFGGLISSLLGCYVIWLTRTANHVMAAYLKRGLKVPRI